MVIRVAAFLPFQTPYYLNGHSYMEGELKRHKIAYRKDDNAFVSVADPTALQAAADRLSPGGDPTLFHELPRKNGLQNKAHKHP